MPKLRPVYCDHGPERILLVKGVLPGAVVFDPRCANTRGGAKPHYPEPEEEEEEQ